MPGRKVREFLKKLVRTRAAPPVDGYSAEPALQTVLGKDEAPAPVTTKHPKITSARFPCQYPGVAGYMRGAKRWQRTSALRT